MLNQELFNYIKVQLRAGFSKAMIYQALRESNWPEELIDEVFAVIENRPLPAGMAEKTSETKFNWYDKKIILVSFLLILLLGSCGFYGWQIYQKKQVRQENILVLKEMEKQKQKMEEEILELASEEATGSIRVGEESDKLLSPQDAWLEMKEVFRQLQTYEDLEAYTLKFGDQKMVDGLQEQRTQVEKMPKFIKDQLVKLAQAVVPDEEITVIDETIEEDLAFLKVYTIDPKLSAEIKLIKRGEEWKLQSEEWINE